ncbi:hypothetical protein AtNW77_Chr1g0036471 [Arabidopsis thaliana]
MIGRHVDQLSGFPIIPTDSILRIVGRLLQPLKARAQPLVLQPHLSASHW